MKTISTTIETLNFSGPFGQSLKPCLKNQLAQHLTTCYLQNPEYFNMNPQAQDIELIATYFEGIDQKKLKQFEALQPIYEEWNAKINVISRKDLGNFYVNHVLHALAIARLIQFKPNSEVMDLGTGGGFPGIPLAIMFPDSHFHLVDSIGKKLKVVDAVVESLKLKNVTTEHNRVEKVQQQFDFVISRAVAQTGELINWTNNKFLPHHFHNLSNGLLLLKGGDLTQELKQAKGKKTMAWAISDFFKEAFFAEKKIVYVQMVK